MKYTAFSLFVLTSALTSTTLRAQLLSPEDDLEEIPVVNPERSSPKTRKAGSECAVTSDQDMFPWWRIELDEVMFVKEVHINTDLSKKYKLHDIEIRVGYEDISQSEVNTTFSANVICNRLPGTLEKPNISHTCWKTSYGGKYVSIQIFKPCMSPLRCPNNHGNTLKLCAVTIFGSKLSEAESTDVKYISMDDSVSKGSSVAFGGFPEKALESKRKITQDPPSLCIQASRKTATSNSRTSVVHEIPLPETYVITDIFMSPEMDPSKYKNSTIKITIGFRFGIIHKTCAIKYKHMASYDFTCGEPIMGNVVKIDIDTFGPLKSESDRFKARCSLQIWGYKAVNLAYRKLTRQSSVKDRSSSSNGSSIAVDGRRTNSYSPACTLIEANDEYPWWMVDLYGQYVVKSIMIVGRNLEGVRIHVGNADISETPPQTIFTENLVCEDFSSYENEYEIPHHIKCGTALFGRYVSVQRATSCKEDPCLNSSLCESSHCNNGTVCSKEECNTTIICSEKKQCTSNSLILCEVEVFGIPADVLYYGNAVYYEETAINSNARGRDLILSFYKPEQTYIWWLLEIFDSLFAVEKVELFTKQSVNETIKFQLQIGAQYVLTLDDTSQEPSKQWIPASKPNQLCFFDDALQLSDKFYSFSCKNTIGKNIFIQYQYLEENMEEQNKSLFFEFATAWVYVIKPLESAFEVESVKNLTGPARRSEKWLADQDSISVEEYSNLLFYPFASDPSTECTYTLPGDPYPWWRIELRKIYRVTSFQVENWEDVKNKTLHDIEIRVGFSDIARSVEAGPFSSNSLCYATGSSKNLPTSKYLECNENAVGVYISIQIVRPCTNAEICDIGDPNILQLCFVSFMGSELYGIRGNKITHAKSILQSSTLDGADASQAFYDSKTSRSDI